ncbi:MAG: phenylphosphate carboxylase subunit delta [Deltaproteobacteria bacterium HGW-Deltaproteobacteria-12]|jgi:3-deoxy-D-manno-octulosonate 8-phosphate phosphatase (KDO 8-P phosphatase)|nr:MAG: phenylphosphate carboxylase subunit delta [Deltaproteobacteria bacterium HGW-Deltaproteobacteria-12]
MRKNLQEKLKNIKMLILDVDGVMTDGRVIMDDSGKEIKNFDVRDGHGIKLIQRYGIKVVLLTGRQSEVVKHRAQDLGIREIYQKVFNKKEVFVKILKKNKLSSADVAFMGDDIVDIPVLKAVGFSAAVADALDVVKKSVAYVTKNMGGRGAVREVCDMLLQAQGKWPEIAAKYEFDEYL